MEDKKVAIIGLGLIGGSLARALHERLGITRIIAVNRSLVSIQQAISDGVISHGFTEINEQVLASDIIFICTPVKRAIEYLESITGKVRPDCIITDVGSTKAEIIDYVNNLKSPPCFIGGHPMAGTEKAGYSAGFAHLFENAYYIMSPCKSTTEDAIALMTEIINGIGGIPVVLDALEHDKITGSISHVPHIIASALVNAVKAVDSSGGKMQMLAAGGFKDITRIASSNPEVWESIISSNVQQIKDILHVYGEILRNFEKYMDSRDSKKVYDFFETAKNYRDSFSENRKGLISPSCEIIVDVIDKPGIIGEIATLLGRNNINIKNISVSNSREFEQGCLRITLPGFESVDIAFALLVDKGYKVYKSN
ncbi:MAG: prephenate dehydrogenase [Actinobacteria bacterium]|nr:prephenate dehydrogenase [Actinomycetota bacterium]